MPFPFENWPYTDLHNLNLDWVLKTMQEMVDEVTKAIDGFTSLKEAVAKNSADIADINSVLGGHADDIAQLRRCCLETRQAISDINAMLETLEAAIKTAEKNANGYTDVAVQNIKDALANGGLLFVIDPTTGNKTDIQTALDNLAGLSKEDAITAGEYDTKNIPAGTYDALKLSAFDYDYHAKTFLASLGV